MFAQCNNYLLKHTTVIFWAPSSQPRQSCARTKGQAQGHSAAGKKDNYSKADTLGAGTSNDKDDLIILQRWLIRQLTRRPKEQTLYEQP